MSSSDPNPRELFPLIIERPSEDVAIEICDAFDQIVAAPLAMHATSSSNVQNTSFGRQLKVELPRGLYVVRGSLGSETRERVVRVSAETKIDAPIPVRATSAAYQGVESSHEYYSYPAADQSKQPTTHVLEEGPAADSWLFLFLRARNKDLYAASQDKLELAAAHLHLETPQGTAIPLASHSKIHADGWLAFSARAPAGDYRLHDLGDEPRTTPVVLYPHWQTQLFLTFDRRVLHSTLHVSLSRPQRGFLPQDEWARAVDLALSVLVSGRGSLPSDARRILLGDKFENPLLGLIAAWTALRDCSSRIEFGQDVLTNLDGLLPDSPDVAVLRVAHARRYGRSLPSQPIRRTPMLRVATSELISVATEHPEILPAESILDDVSPRLYADSAFTSWRPLDSELPASLRLSRSTARLVSCSHRSTFDVLISASTGLPAGIESAVQEPEHVPAEEDPGAWLQEAVAEVIELQARRKRDQSTSSSLDISRMAKRTGVTTRAVRQVLESAPLENLQVALSLSDTPNAEGLKEDSTNHVIDATVYLARTLISAGASIAYGGDFRKNGYTPLLAELIKTYNQTATRPAQSLHSYLGVPIQLGEIPLDLPLVIHHLIHSPEVACDALMPPPSATDQPPSALYFSDMRRVMAKHTFARIILGGQTEPRTQNQGSGYGGRYPGVVEEAWRTLDAGKPLYILGGFGGAAGLVADLFEEGQDIPVRLLDQTFAKSQYYQDNATAIDINPYREKLGLPQRMEDLAQAVRKLAMSRLANDQESVQWNGLTSAENRTLFRTRDPMILASLVLKGLLTVARGSGFSFEISSSARIQFPQIFRRSVAMAHEFDRSVARLALEICRYTYAAGVGGAESEPEKTDALRYINAQPTKPIADPISVVGSNRTSFACVVPYADRNVVSYMGTKTEFGFNKLAELDDLVKSGQVLTMLREAKSIIEQFRDSLRDWGQNGKARPVAFELAGKHIGQPNGVTLEGRVHHGFLSELQAVQEGIVATLNRHGGVARPVLVTGHSQGGAEAALATRALAAAGFNVEVTYTFAAPRTGSAEFVNSVKTPVHRIEFGDDIVPHLPPTLIKTALEEIVAHHPVLLVALKAALHTVEDVGYVGLGSLCYGHPGEKKFHIGLSTAAEKTLFDERLKRLSKNPKHWGDHHHLVGTQAESTATPRVPGNYTVLVSPDGWPVAS